MTDTIRVYTIDELEEEIREKVVEKNYDINVRYNWWDYLIYQYAEEAEKIGFAFEEKDVSFDLGRANYLGVYFKNVHLEWHKFLENLSDYLSSHYVQRVEDGDIHFGMWSPYGSKKVGTYRTEFPSIGQHGTGTDFFENEIIFYYDCQKKDHVRERLNDCFADMWYDFTDLSTNYLSHLHDEFNYLTSEEAIVETLKVNEHRFTANGTMV